MCTIRFHSEMFKFILIFYTSSYTIFYAINNYVFFLMKKYILLHKSILILLKKKIGIISKKINLIYRYFNSNFVKVII